MSEDPARLIHQQGDETRAHLWAGGLAELPSGSAFASEDTQGRAFEKEGKEAEGIVKDP